MQSESPGAVAPGCYESALSALRHRKGESNSPCCELIRMQAEHSSLPVWGEDEGEGQLLFSLAKLGFSA